MTFEAMQVTLVAQINYVFADEIQMSTVRLHGITISHTFNDCWSSAGSSIE